MGGRKWEQGTATEQGEVEARRGRISGQERGEILKWRNGGSRKAKKIGSTARGETGQELLVRRVSYII